MEAMKVMGMAASQARFLGLTARKSNVEYQGQQINQQRTALSNESANLYNQMMELTVPTPPSTSDYYHTYYVLEDSSDDGGYSKSDYKMGNIVKTYDEQNGYRITLTTDVTYTEGIAQKYKLGAVTTSEDGITTIPLGDTKSGRVTNITYDPKVATATDDNDFGAQNLTLYAVTKDEGGFSDCFPESEEKGFSYTDEGGNPKYYYYRTSSGSDFKFISAEDLQKLQDGEDGYQKDSLFAITTPNTFTKEESIEVKGTLDSSVSTGRYTTITIENSDDVPSHLQGKTFNLNTVEEMNQNEYDDAYNDYEYNKALYEQSISDINAQTEIIQNQDQQLELRLQQLNTEQDAISTEMDSVSKVIEDNVEKTFKVFA